ncbi:MAG: helicase-related protein, partial [Actinomycetota bacterium]
HDVRAVVMHGNMSQNARERSLAQFEAGKVSTLVATDVAARGLDVDGITHVINFDPPEDEKAYVHRVGRTARAGRGGTGITFVTPEKRSDVGKIAKVLELHVEFGEAGLRMDAPRPGPSRGRASRRMGDGPRRSSEGNRRRS